MFPLGARCFGQFLRGYTATTAPIIRRRVFCFSLVIPVGQSIRNRFVAHCQNSNQEISELFGSKLHYHHDTLEKARWERRNFIMASLAKIGRLIRITLRLFQLIIIYTPLLIWYPIARRNEARFQRWRSWLLYMVERSGPAIIKFAQWASTRRDLFSKEFCDLFSQLHTQTSPHSWSRTDKAMKEALGEKWRSYFLEFEEKPCGSGCVAQVHKAKLNYIGLQQSSEEIRKKFDSSDMPWVDVAIKVTHPGIREQIADDLTILSAMANLAEFFVPRIRYWDPKRCLQEFRTALIRQLDMRYEGDALRIFSRQFIGDKTVGFPKPLFQTENILIETFEPGTHIANYLSSDDTELKQQLAKMGMSALLKMVFVNNFVHGDLHPGNILVQEYVEQKPRRRFGNRIRAFARYLRGGDDITLSDAFETETGTRLVFLDAGISIRLNERDLKNIRAVFKAVVEGDGAKVGDLLLRYSPHQTCSDTEAFKKDIDVLINRTRASTVSLATMDVSSLLSDLLSAVSRHRVSLDPNFSGVVLAVLILEGLGRSLYPQLDLLAEARPVLFSLV